VLAHAEARCDAAGSRSLSLTGNFAWTLAGQVVYAGCQWGMLIVLARVGSPEMVGQFALGLALTAPVFMLSNLQLRAVQSTDAKGEYRFGEYLALRLLTTGLAALTVAALAAFGGYRLETALVVLAVGLSKSVESISDVFYGLFQQHEAMNRIAGSLLLRGPLSLAALGLGVYLTGSVLWGAVGLALAWSLVLVGHDTRAGARLPGEPGWPSGWERRRLVRLARLALPLGVVMMLISLNASVPAYFVARHLGEAALGVFAAMAYLMTAGGLVVNALGQSATPRLARYCAAGDRAAFRGLLARLVGAGLLLGAAGLLAAWLAGPELLALLYPPDYARHADVLVWLMAAAAIGYVASFLGYGMTAARLFRVQPPLFAVAAGVTAVACAVLVPRYGLAGAAWACVASSAVQLAGGLLWSASVATEGRR
jgi:O-antigen/teichoic acid export membrane protein